ncbi:MAG: hypothetical protein ACUVXG_04370 [Anaerolineae bacterium]
MREFVEARDTSTGGVGTVDVQTWLARLRRAWETFLDFLYGASVYDFVLELRQEKAALERLFVLAVLGDVLGVPILPPYYALRLLPYMAPHLPTWKMSMLRERDLTDLVHHEMG